MAVHIIRGRQTVVILTNKTGGAVALGDVVIVSGADANSFVSTAVEGQSAECSGVALEAIPNNDIGRVLTHGYTPQINLDGAAALRDFVMTDGVALQGTPVAAPATGVFAQVLEVGSTPAAIIWPFPMQAGGRTGDDHYGLNLIKNSPGQIPVDGAEPQWWDESSGNATLTDEGTVGEGIPDIHERVFKLVTIADDEYGYQTFTLADEALLDAGVTVVSLGCWVYCATGGKASVAVFGTNLGLQESAQVGAAAWEWVEVNNITLNAGDATIQVRFIADTDTAWMTMPMFAVGSVAQPWIPRDTKFVPSLESQVLNVFGGDVAWSDLDITAETDPLAVALSLLIEGYEWVVSGNSYSAVGHHDDIMGADQAVGVTRYQGLADQAWIDCAPAPVRCNDSQVFRYTIVEADADSDTNTYIWVTGYWMWN